MDQEAKASVGRKRLLYVDHSFHRKTESTQFMLRALQKKADVDVFWDDHWNGGPKFEPDSMKEPDLAVFFQTEPPVEVLYKWKCPIVVIPMADSPYSPLTDTCLRFSNCLVIAFSDKQAKTYHEKKVRVAHIQFACTVPFKRSKRETGITAFFWERSDVRWHHVRKLLSETQVTKTFLKLVPDPGFTASEVSLEDQERFGIEFVNSWGSKDSYWELLSECDVYFAPRAKEGIGMSFIEAMAIGLCVVAPNGETMNEYIAHGITGYLYGLNDPEPLGNINYEDKGEASATHISKIHERFRGELEQLTTTILNLQAKKPSLKTQVACRITKLAMNPTNKKLLKHIRGAFGSILTR